MSFRPIKRDDNQREGTNSRDPYAADSQFNYGGRGNDRYGDSMNNNASFSRNENRGRNEDFRDNYNTQDMNARYSNREPQDRSDNRNDIRGYGDPNQSRGYNDRYGGRPEANYDEISRGYPNYDDRQSNKNDSRGEFRNDSRNDYRNEQRGDTRGDFRNDSRNDFRNDQRGGSRGDFRNDSRNDFRNDFRREERRPFNDNRSRPYDNRGNDRIQNTQSVPPSRHSNAVGNEVVANRFQLKLNKPIMYRYEVFFKTEVKLQEVGLRKALNLALGSDAIYAFDNISIIVSPEQYNWSRRVVPVGKGNVDCTIDLQLVREVNFNHILENIDKNILSTDVIQFATQTLEVILKEIVVHSKRERFFDSSHVYIDYRDAWLGSLGRERLLSLLLGCCFIPNVTKDYGWSITCNLSGKPALKSCPLVDVVNNILRSKNVNDITRVLPEVNSIIKKIRVEKNHFSGEKRQNYKRLEVNGFVTQKQADKENAGGVTAREYFFDLTKDGGTKRVSVEQYFENEYRIRLKYPNWPLVRLKNDSPCPIEVLDVVGGSIVKIREDNIIKGDIVKQMTMPSKERAAIILDYVKKMFENCDKLLDYFGIEVSKKFSPVKSSEIAALNLQYADARARGKTCEPSFSNCQIQNGKFNLRDKKFVYPKSLDSYILLDCRRRPNMSQFHKVIDGLFNCAQNVGISANMSILDTQLRNSFPYYSDKISSFMGNEQILSEVDRYIDFILSRSNNTLPQIAIILLENQDLQFYAKVTYLLLSKCITTQCITAIKAPCLQQNARGNPNEFWCNIWSKINLKIGGSNRVLSNTSYIRKLDEGNDEKRPCIVIGADVTHPKETISSTVSPSIASLTLGATCWTDGYYKAEVRALVTRQEMLIDELRSMAVNLCKKSDRLIRNVPKSILYFRDGVGEDSFEQVIEEAKLIKDGIQHYFNKFDIALTCIVACKRGQLRFFSAAGNVYSDVTPGTLLPCFTRPNIKKELLNTASRLSSYMISHKAVKGTAHPCRYEILLDENDITKYANENTTVWETICYELTGLNGRSLTINSYPAPTRFADMCAEKARKFLYDFDEQIRRRDFYGSPEELKEERRIVAQKANLILEKLNQLPAMYWV